MLKEVHDNGSEILKHVLDSNLPLQCLKTNPVSPLRNNGLDLLWFGLLQLYSTPKNIIDFILALACTLFQDL